MKANVGYTLMAAGALAAVAMLATPAHAQNAPAQVQVQVTPMPYPTTPARPVGAERTEFVTPNAVWLAGGGMAILGAYIPGLVVAASSDHDGDKWLYAPIIGPWFDLATRGCDDNEIDRTNCGTNGFDRAALIGSGSLQALGVLAVIGSFAMPQRRLVTTTGQWHLAPASFSGRGQGIMAFGTF
jgi:hypothetical protein